MGGERGRARPEAPVGSRSNVTAFVLCALVAAFMALTWLVLFHYLATHERQLARQTPASFFARERRLLITSVLPVFCGASCEGWSGTWNLHREGSWS